MILRHILLVILFTSLSHSASIQPRNTRLCPDGKTSPLLEGEFNVFPCVSGNFSDFNIKTDFLDCPSGFTCENQDSPDGGICCPDLDLLYELYSDDKQRDIPSKDAFDIPDVPNLPVVFMDGSKELIKNEVRRAPISTTLAPKTNNFTIFTLSATRSFSTTQAPTKFPFITQPQKILGLNCRRQQLQHRCNGFNGRQSSTQYVIRWYKQNGACHSYIYGYCPGTRIDLDITLRTKDDCEALCLSADEFQQSDLLKFLVSSLGGKNDFSIRSHAAPLLKSAETFELLQNKKLDSDIVSFQSSHDSLLESEITTTLAPRKRCSRLPYRSMCPENNMPSQFTIRWYRNQNGICTAYGFGFCHGETVFDNKTLKSKEECTRYCPGLSANSEEKIDFASRLIR